MELARNVRQSTQEMTVFTDTTSLFSFSMTDYYLYQLACSKMNLCFIRSAKYPAVSKILKYTYVGVYECLVSYMETSV